RARDGGSRAVSTDVNVTREPWRSTPDIASRGHRIRPGVMSASTPVAEPAGGTTTRSSAGRRAFCFPGSDHEADDRAAEDLYPTRRRRRDLRALARGGRLRARWRRDDRGSGPAAVHDHPAAAERDGFAPPGPRPADGGRGSADPPRADARAPDAV